MAARTFTSAGVNNLWSNAANWDGGTTIPAEDDSVTIPAGQTCEYDYNSAYTTGIAGITITGTLKLTRTPGTYRLFMKAGTTIGGAGTFDCGASALDAIPFAAKHTITGGAGWYIKGNDGAGMTMTVFAAEPSIKTVLLTQQESAGATVLHVDTDITGDIWEDGDTVRICEKDYNGGHEERVIAAGGRAAGTITITAGLTAAKVISSTVALITRNVKFIGVSVGTGLVMNFASGKLTVAGGMWYVTDSNKYGFYTCPGIVVSDGAFACFTSLHSSINSVISGGVFAGGYYAVGACDNLTISGGTFLSFTNNVVSASSKNITITGGTFRASLVAVTANAVKISGGTFDYCNNAISGCNGLAISGGTFSSQATTAITGCVNVIITGGTFSNNVSAIYGSAVIIKNTAFSSNTQDINQSGVSAYSTLFGSTTENANYALLPREVYSESIDHDQVAGAFRSWTKGGVTSSQAVTVPTGFTQAMQTVLENAAVEGYWQKEITVGAGASVNITSYLRKAASMAYLPRVIVFNKASADPFAGGAGLHTFTMTDSIDTWESDLYTYTNSGTADVTLVIRTQGMAASGSVYSLIDVEQINVDLTTALAGIAAIKAKTDPITYTIANQIDANALSGGTDATQIRAAIGMNAANLDTQLSGIPAAVWAVATSTLTAAGTIGKYIMDLIAGVWAYVSRTLTQTSAQVQAAMSGTTMLIHRGDTFTAPLTGLGNISTRTKLYFTVKGNKSDLDSGAIIQLEETAGLTVLNGAAYTTVTDGSIVVTDAVTGALTITLKPDVTKSLAGNGLYYDLQIVTATGVTTITAATCNVVEDVTRAVS